MRVGGLWLSLFILLSVASATPAGRHADHAAALWSAHVAGAARPDLMVIWVLGAPLAAVALLLLFTADSRYTWRQRWAAWGLLAAAAAVELLCKHLGIGGNVAAVAVPAMPHLAPRLAALERHLAVPVIGRLSALASQVTLRGTFPSGHVLRLTLAAGYALARPGWMLPVAVAVAAGFCVTATGGHSATDALGGAALALAGLAVAGRLGGR